MAAPTVYEGIAEDIQLDGLDQLFAGKKFWVAQRVPRRNQFLDDIRANGGEIVMLEKKADYLIADHFRRDCPPGSISYEFVDKSIRDGRVRDPEDHRAGPRLGEAREPGALNRPTKSSRAAFTAEEDNILYKWVRDFEKQGGAIGGNEIYKQLEAKYPRHTFQSWRDRYLKQLRNRPPSAFNIPNNAPPSPPSDGAERAPNPKPVSSKAKRTAPQPQNTDGTSNIGKTRKKPEVEQDYTLEQLAATFTSDDWEELYAFVDIIEERANDEDEYTASWGRWAKSQGNRTAEQWRQYYEKVVRPQWRRDPEWKRDQVKEKVEKKYEERSSQSQNMAKAQPNSEDASPTSRSPNNDLPEESVAQEATTTTGQLAHEEESLKKEPPQQPSVPEQGEPGRAEPETKAMSSTAQYQSPSYISAVYQNAMKRMHDFTRSRPPEENESPRPTKRQRSTSPARNDKADGRSVLGTQEQPLEIFSSPSSTKTSQPEAYIFEATGNHPGADKPEPAGAVFEDFVEIKAVEAEDDVMESREVSDLDELPDQASESDLPSNTPTPRAPQQRPGNFDTQAILSFTLQNMQIPRPPQPTLPEDTQRSSSLAPHPSSEISTTHSLEEFRRSLNDSDRQVIYPALNLPSHTPSPSPTPSIISIAPDEDPDPPLDASELNEYFDVKLEEGFPDEFIIKALKRTRFRPDLTDLVLEAWGAGQPLPNQRGIWSLDEDEAVEKGDGVVLAGLERKHTLDGWGGITERLKFLEGYRSR